MDPRPWLRTPAFYDGALFVTMTAVQQLEGSVSEKSNREVIERYIRAIAEQDFDTQDQLRHADYVSEWPQSGERVRGAANARDYR